MEEMRELYEKVAKSPMLQKKLTWIAGEAAAAGRKKTRERLIDFMKEAGFDISIEDMRAFFSDRAEKRQTELTETELETVAGGADAQYAFIRLFTEYI